MARRRAALPLLLGGLWAARRCGIPGAFSTSPLRCSWLRVKSPTVDCRAMSSSSDSEVGQRKQRSWHLAELYLALSNLHRVEEIAALLTEEAVVYGAQGRASALAKMRSFHATFSDAFWTCSAMRHVDEEGLQVEFDFTRFFTAPDGQVMAVDATDVLALCPETGRLHSIGYSREPGRPRPVAGFPQARPELLQEAERRALGER